MGKSQKFTKKSRKIKKKSQHFVKLNKEVKILQE